jgi:serine/threonine-protein kinase
MTTTQELPTVTTPGSHEPPDTDPRKRQFLPGTRLGKRYRIVELLGRGGTGEVYRADDLQLGHPVALKFLPAHLTHDAGALARLRNEVRVAREVSHPNVCRVHDIAEEGGHVFLSMEFVDGEDLASVLRRLGRPTADKSLEIARQLCAGLAAAHERGVLHRDLKPANVMIDGRGRVRITDFGLAGFARELKGITVHGGTPGYMAPEQLEGGALSPRSDIYSLGLVLYELFTGRPAFRAESISDLARQYASTTPQRPSQLVGDIDPDVEAVVLRCLDRLPGGRPASALSVAAALPGGDPLTEALAAGDTPSPEMIAAAGGHGGLTLAVAGACLLATLVGIVALALMNERSGLFRLAGPEKPPSALAEQAREIFRDIGLTDTPADTAHGFNVYRSYLGHVTETDDSATRWAGLGDVRPQPYYFWYRQSPTPLAPLEPFSRVTLQDPPPRITGMAEMCLDGKGRLRCLEIVPPQFDDDATPVEPADYTRLFAAAGLDPVDFVETRAQWTPTFYADERRAWVGTYSDQLEPELRIEAAAYRGLPVYFEVFHPFDQEWRAPQTDTRTLMERASQFFSIALLLAVAIGAVLIARRNLRSGQGDRTSAVRLGFVVLTLAIVNWALGADHVPSVGLELWMLLKALGLALVIAIWTALAYLALEPTVRKLLPHTLISWTRVLRSCCVDARVGRDILVGGLAGILVTIVHRLEFFAPGWFGRPGRVPFSAMLDPGRQSLAGLFEPYFLITPMFMLVLLAGLLFVLRRRGLAIAAAFVIMALFDQHWDVFTATDAAVVAAVAAVVQSVLVWALLWFLMVRYGLLASVTSWFFITRLQLWPLTLDTSAWYGVTSFTLIAVLAAIALYGFRLSIGRRRLIGTP